jgi:N-acyl-D-aspartate/D-glutamate deacylase
MFPFGDPPDYAPPASASIAAMAAREGRRAEEVAYDLLIADAGRGFIFAPLTNFADYPLSASAECLRHPNAIAGFPMAGRMLVLSPTGPSRPSCFPIGRGMPRKRSSPFRK